MVCLGFSSLVLTSVNANIFCAEQVTKLSPLRQFDVSSVEGCPKERRRRAAASVIAAAVAKTISIGTALV